jgi:LacI family transcriptional regulator
VLTFVADPDDPVSSYLALADTGRVDGFVLAYTVQDDPRIRRLLDWDIPFVAFGRANDAWDFAYVDVDGECGMCQVVEHLIAHGHQRIGLINWPGISQTGSYRRRGYLKALERAGISFNERWEVIAENTAIDGRLAAQQLMAQPEDTRPTAIACVSDIVAIGAMQFLHEVGVVVGQDVAVTGFDDIPTTPYLTPPLTSVRQPLDLIGERLIALLMDRLRGTQHHEKRVLLAPELVVRASSGGPI